MGLLAFFLRAVLYRVLGGTLPDGAGVGAGDGNWAVANLFCFAAFALALVLGLLLGGSFKTVRQAAFDGLRASARITARATARAQAF